ncbi:uncharacterized protein LOC105426824 [Pogonomyrmex barbatus]|uniref:Uncharacterized protein LOC105426824 n=1 Tax=Pogonomyrmex barbatus TaxID=144034 RepID=A0A6I9W518_9HYME|nr:uncharacterized protein LOC105426824 [Pogonomyrmex barbatus]
MAIMQSCCCWQSVRRGSYACAIYTIIYFALLASTTGTTLRGESQYLKGDVSLPESISFLESGTISPTTVQFNGMLLICSCCGVLCSLLLLYGLYKDRKMLLIPWIVAVITCGIIDVAHSLYLFIVTYPLKVPVVRYVTQPPTTTATTSCLSSRKGVTNNETKATPTQSPTTCHNPLLSEKSPTGSRLSRKHVQFPDTSDPSQIERPEIPITKMPTKFSSKVERNTRTWLQPSDAITIVVNQSSPSSDDEQNHCS